MQVDNEKAIRSIVSSAVKSFASGFSTRHLSEVDNPDGVINSKIHNVFISILGDEIAYFSALSRSLDSSLGNMLENMTIDIAKLHYEVSQSVTGFISKEQTEYIADILEEYKRHVRKPSIDDYRGLSEKFSVSSQINKRHDSDYYLFDKESGLHYLIELKIGGDLDNKKARSEKEALLEQYCILANNLQSEDKIKVCFATAYNRYGEGKPWKQGRVLQFFANEELLISSDFWNLVCKSSDGYNIVLDEYKRNAHYIISALSDIKDVYLSE